MSEAMTPANDRPAKRNASDIIAASGLPQDVTDLLRDVIGRTRLWKREKAEVALELVAHFQDGIEAGRPVEELRATFGDVTQTAKLIRRGKKRNRPLWWKMLGIMTRAFGCVLLIYAALFGWMAVTHPTPNIDYVAQINHVAASADASDQAWPIYRQAWADAGWSLSRGTKGPTDALYKGENKSDDVTPGDVEWPVAAAYLHEQKSFLDAIRLAGSKRRMGLIVAHQGAFRPEDAAAFNAFANIAPPAKDGVDKLMNDSLIALLLPHLASMRAMASLLAADMYDAADQKDPARVLADYSAMLGMARQTQEHPTTVSYLVGLGTCIMADDRLAEIHLRYPDLSENRRVALLHAMANVQKLFELDISGERAMGLDVLQRTYTDSGNGDGHLTLQGLQVMLRLSSPAGTRSRDEAVGGATATILSPALAGVIASRREMTRVTEEYFRLVQQDLDRPMWERLGGPSRAEAYVAELKARPLGHYRYLPFILVAPSLNRAGIVSRVAQGRHEALMCALTLETYRERTGRYPESLSQLVPQFLPQIPLDHSTGKPLRYRLQDGRPLLYGLGKNGTDEGGIWTDQKTNWPNVPDTGDWVLYPPVKK